VAVGEERGVAIGEEREEGALGVVVLPLPAGERVGVRGTAGVNPMPASRLSK